MKVKKLVNDAVVPEHKTEGAAAFDLHITEDIRLGAHTSRLVGTGIAVELKPGQALLLFIRSGTPGRNKLALANGVGLLDSDYRGEIKLNLLNISDDVAWANKGDRIAQAMVVNFVKEDIEIVDELGETDRGDGGFGSTGSD